MDKCKEYRGGGYFSRPCGRDVVEGEKMCARHLAGQRRRDKARAKHQARWDLMDRRDKYKKEHQCPNCEGKGYLGQLPE